MAQDMSTTGLQLQSLVKNSGVLEVSLAEVPLPVPAADEVLVRVEATPINPSDLGLLFGAGDMASARQSGTRERPMITADISPAGMRAMAARLDVPMPVGNEGAGTVLAAGSSALAQSMLGKIVTLIGGAMYAQYRCVPAADCMVLPAGATAADGASCFVNPLTALSMVETMRLEGYSALVHTAAASNLGQMLNKICIADGIALVNIVRNPAQAQLLRDSGATYVCDSSAPSFMADLIAALTATGATLAFDAIGGGKLAGQILTAMEAAVNARATGYSRYGSAVHKQVYIYGSLDMRPTEFGRGFGMAWGVGGWLLTPFLQKLPRADAQRLRDRVLRELKTTFASHYTQQVTLAEALDLQVIAAYNRRATGEKYLITPHGHSA